MLPNEREFDVHLVSEVSDDMLDRVLLRRLLTFVRSGDDDLEFRKFSMKGILE